MSRRNLQTAQVTAIFTLMLVGVMIYNRGGEPSVLEHQGQRNHHARHISDFRETEEHQPDKSLLELGNGPFARPFHSGDVKQVVLLAYQRCGSTFMGQLFNQNPEAFYMFEPLDSIYTAMYGTRPGWNVPSDIFTFGGNGSARSMPADETEAVASTLGKLLSCDMDGVPTEVLIHKFWGQFRGSHTRLVPFIKCLLDTRVAIRGCRDHIQAVCPGRFGGDYEQSATCRNYLAGRQRGPHAGSFSLYHRCIDTQRQLAGTCIDEIKQVCENSYLRTAKTVRLTMASGEKLLRQYRNMRIIQLVRDPRAVASSRMRDTSYRGLFAGNEIVKEASVYCSATVEDIRLRKRLEVAFPGSTMQIIYEQFVSDPLQGLRDMYGFLNATVPAEVNSYVEENTSHLKNSSLIAAKWQEKLSYRQTRQINQVCAQLYDEIDYQWPR